MHYGLPLPRRYSLAFIGLRSLAILRRGVCSSLIRICDRRVVRANRCSPRSFELSLSARVPPQNPERPLRTQLALSDLNLSFSLGRFNIFPLRSMTDRSARAIIIHRKASTLQYIWIMRTNDRRCTLPINSSERVKISEHNNRFLEQINILFATLFSCNVEVVVDCQTMNFYAYMGNWTMQKCIKYT